MYDVGKLYFYLLQASFVASGNRTDISLDDPNFWQKWAKKAEIDIDAISGRVSTFLMCVFSSMCLLLNSEIAVTGFLVLFD